MAEGEIEYESDPEEAKLSLKMRRREASDDEEEEVENCKEELLPGRRMDDSDVEPEGAVAEYEEDELEEDYDLEEYVEDEEEYEEITAGRIGDFSVEAVVVVVEKDEPHLGELVEEKKGVSNDEMYKNATEIDDVDNNVMNGQHEEEKKEIEPYAVPTVGAFYMHDDRFRDNAGGGRHRRMVGGRKLWESKDDRKWGHDKFEELTLQERHHEEHKRGSRGRHRGRGGNRGSDRGYSRLNRSMEYTNNSTQNNTNRNSVPKGVRGRGPRRYQPLFKNENEMHHTQNKQSGKSLEKPSYIVSSARSSEVASNDLVQPRKQTPASNLSIASPPFYPSSSSAKDIPFSNKRDVQTSTTNRNGQPSVVDKTVTVSQSTSMMRGKNMVDYIGVDKLHIDDSAEVRKPSTNLRMPLSGSSSVNSTQPHFRGQGRGITSSRQMTYQPTVSNNQVNRVPSSSQLQSTSTRNNGQGRTQSYVQVSGPHLTHFPSGSQASTQPNDGGAVNAFESGELESVPEPGKSKSALVAKGNGILESGRSSFLYGGAQVLGASGNLGSGRGDQNFPAFLPVMQFGGQHPGGMGVPAVGMAFPGYVSQPQNGGRGNSEMTWLPVLAGAAGALGANFCSPYIAVDGSYHACSSGQPSSIISAPSKENNATNVGNDHRPELANEEFGQKQKNSRRYTEMKFDQ